MINNFTIDDVRRFWDKAASDYEFLNRKVGYVHTQRFEKAMELGKIEAGQKILNIWSRTGSLLPYLRSISNLEIHNREVSPKIMEIARKRYPNENFCLTDLENLSEFESNYFDRIISLETLEHTPKPLLLLRELHRILKPDGLLIMSLPPKGEEVPEFIYKLFFKDHGEGPHNFLWPYQVKKLIKESGFSLISHNPYIILPLGNDKLTRISEKVLTFIFGKTPFANFGVRHFYISKKIICAEFLAM